MLPSILKDSLPPILVAVLLIGSLCAVSHADEASKLAESLRKLSTNVYNGDASDEARRSVSDDLRSQLQKANDNSRKQWQEIKSPKQWDEFRSERLAALRASLGTWPDPPKTVRTVVTNSVEGDGFAIDNILFKSRLGWLVTANLYRPTDSQRGNLQAARPGIIISHSHHRPKEHSELQDMGMTWARAGCYVLVPDHLGHGERGQHGFTSSDDFPRNFAVSRQDYYFRYDNSIQLYLAGESLMGWMAWDLMRGVDVLLQQVGIDKDKIILLGAVAGGGDPCAVTAALDERIACAVPFNFGGPQPETRYPLPEDAETWFNYAGSGSWESTRNLAFSASEDSRFLPWEIVGSIAPRRLIFGHEFNWHRERDPVWKRLERIYELQDASDHLAYTHGRGELKGRPPEATHCTHIGKFHRAKIHEALATWFDIHAEEYSHNIDSSKLRCRNARTDEVVKSRLLCEVLAENIDQSLSAAREKLIDKSSDARREILRAQFDQLLSQTEMPAAEVADESDHIPDKVVESGEQTFQVIPFTAASDRPVPCVLLLPKINKKDRVPVVLGLAQGGKQAFLKHRADEVAKLLTSGVAICLPDVTNTGELTGDNSRGRYSSATSRAATALMVGDPIVAQQLRDVRAVLRELRTGEHVKTDKIAIWGDSFSQLNEADTDFRVPRRIDGRPHDVEPLGSMLALLTALYDDDVAAVYLHRGLAEFRGAFDSPFVYVPLDSVIPGLLNHADIPDLAAALAPCPLRLDGTVDAYNRELSNEATLQLFNAAWQQYQHEKVADRFSVVSEDSPSGWLIQQLTDE